jgi:hypothetical protein
MGWKTTFSYAVSTSTGSGETTVTDPDGNTTVYDYDQGALAAQSEWTGAAGSGTLASETDDLPDTTVTAVPASCPSGDTGNTDGSLGIRPPPQRPASTAPRPPLPRPTPEAFSRTAAMPRLKQPRPAAQPAARPRSHRAG